MQVSIVTMINNAKVGNAYRAPGIRILDALMILKSLSRSVTLQMSIDMLMISLLMAIVQFKLRIVVKMYCAFIMDSANLVCVI